MAVPLATGDLLQLRVQCYQTPQLGENILHYRVSVTGTGNTMENVGSLMDAIFAPLYIVLLNQVAEYFGTSIRRLTPNPTYEVNRFLNRNTGGGGLLPMPTQVTGLITKYSTSGGRAGRGRAYIPFPSVTDNDVNDTPNAAYQTKLAAIAAAMLDGPQTFGAAPNVVTLTPVILHRTNPLTWVDVYIGRAQKLWATQRRRGNFGRTNPPPA